MLSGQGRQGLPSRPWNPGRHLQSNIDVKLRFDDELVIELAGQSKNEYRALVVNRQRCYVLVGFYHCACLFAHMHVFFSVSVLVCEPAPASVPFFLSVLLSQPLFLFLFLSLYTYISGCTSAWVKASDHLVLGFCTLATRLPPSFFLSCQSLPQT